jgi:hypothetical protein
LSGAKTSLSSFPNTPQTSWLFRPLNSALSGKCARCFAIPASARYLFIVEHSSTIPLPFAWGTRFEVGVFRGEAKFPMIDEPKDPDIQDVMKEEKSRGKRRVDTKALQQRKYLLNQFREALKLRTEREFVEAIRELGFADDPERLREALKIWRSSF